MRTKMLAWITIGTFQGGTARATLLPNRLPWNYLSAASSQEALRELLPKRIEQIAQGLRPPMGLHVQFEYLKPGYPASF